MRNKYKGTKERKLSNCRPAVTLKGKSLTITDQKTLNVNTLFKKKKQFSLFYTFATYNGKP